MKADRSQIEIGALAYVRNGAEAQVHVGAEVSGRQTTIDRFNPGAIGYERGATLEDLQVDPFIAGVDAMIVRDPDSGELSVATGPTNMVIVRIAWIAPPDWPTMDRDGEPVWISVSVDDLTDILTPTGQVDPSGSQIFETLFTPADELIPKMLLNR